jgi:hypothetical protein
VGLLFQVSALATVVLKTDWEKMVSSLSVQEHALSIGTRDGIPMSGAFMHLHKLRRRIALP